VTYGREGFTSIPARRKPSLSKKERDAARRESDARLRNQRVEGDTVYFIIESGDYSRVKIGRTTRTVGERINGLNSGNWRELVMWKCVDGLDEKELHARFDHLRIRGEWFIVDDVLLEYIESLTESE
jgi:hypothetical protein